jgi:hypothetical protein
MASPLPLQRANTVCFDDDFSTHVCENKRIKTLVLYLLPPVVSANRRDVRLFCVGWIVVIVGSLNANGKLPFLSNYLY